MDILAASKREEKKLEKQLGKIQHQLNAIRAAAKALGDSNEQSYAKQFVSETVLLVAHLEVELQSEL